MKPSGIAVLLVALLAGPVLSGGDGKVSMTDKPAAKAALRGLFEAKGRAGLAKLADDPDPMIALHAAWERGKGDQEKTGAFVASFERRMKVGAPQWWKDLLGRVVVHNTCHSVPGVDGSGLKARSRMTTDRLEIVADPTDAGFEYGVEVRDRQTGKAAWGARVWAAGRTVLAGQGVHQIELNVSDGRLFVFGAESNGIYAEAFDLADGRPLLRFCTCYWFDSSENWNLK